MGYIPECLPTAPILPHLSTSPCLEFTSQDLASSCCYDEMPEPTPFKQQWFPSHRGGGCEIQNQRANRFGVSGSVFCFSQAAGSVLTCKGTKLYSGPLYEAKKKNPPMRLHPLHAIIPSQRYHLLIPSYKVKFSLERLKHTDMGLWQPVSSASSSLVLEHSDLSYVTSVGVAGRIRTGSN